MIRKKDRKTEAVTEEEHISYGFFSNSRYIISMMHRYKKGLIFMMVLCACIQAVNSYMWGFIGKICIDMIQKKQISQDIAIRSYLQIMLIIFLVMFILLTTYNLCNQRLQYQWLYVRMKMCQLRIEKALKMNYQTLEEPKMLDRMNNATRATLGTNGIGGMMYNLFNILCSIVSFLCAGVIISTLNAGIIVVVTILAAIQFYFYTKALQSDKKATWDEMSPIIRRLDYIYRIGTDFSFAKDIRLFHMKDWIKQRQADYFQEKQDKIVCSKKIWLRYDQSEKIVGVLRNGILYGYLIYRALYTNLTAGNFTMYLTSALTLSGTMVTFFMQIGGFGRASAETDDFRSFVESKTEEQPTIEIPKCDSYEFRFENVSFCYPNRKEYALKNLNLTIEAGKRLAVVGLNGAGKTTMIKLLLRLYDVTEGRILMNGIDIREFDKEAYYHLFAPVFQNVEIFAFPMAENVSMSSPEETDKKKAEQMLKQAGMEEKVESLEKGVDTELLKVLHSDGIDLSGGEKQKLALARALYKEAPIVVLDEPTAALDALAEYQLYNGFDQLIGNKTAVYISHRLSSTRFCDQIVMFKDGQMIEYGTHEELLQKDGEYAKMFHIQSQYYTN